MLNDIQKKRRTRELFSFFYIIKNEFFNLKRSNK